MKHTIDYKREYDSERWIAYFDLLGITRLDESGGKFGVFDALSKAIEELRKQRSHDNEISFARFSDTFIIYTKDDSDNSFCKIHIASQFFVFWLLQAGIPVTGAIACDRFYADDRNDIYLGKGLIEAHEYGEAQDWIGFILCPSAENKLSEYQLVATKFDYAYTRIPYKNKYTKKIPFVNIARREKNKLKSNLPAFILGAGLTFCGNNSCLVKLKEMFKKHKDNPKDAKKYLRAINFIEENKNQWRQTSVNEGAGNNS